MSHITTVGTCFSESQLRQGSRSGSVSGSSLAEKVDVSSMKEGQAMTFCTIVMTGLALVGSASLAAANPSLLPKHPGYPSGGEYANDTGQKNLTVEQSLSRAAASEDAHTGQKLVDPYNARLLKPQGAGQLPTVEGPQIKIAPPVTEATRMPKQ
jgi:hypothetical protein